MNAGDDRQRLDSPPTLVEERRLFAVLARDPGRHCRSAQRAHDEIIRRNLGLVGWVARDFWISDGSALSREDLRQAGVLGLIKAVERFDPSHGTRFSTYATCWIRQAIGRHLDNAATTVRIPAHVRCEQSRVRRGTSRKPQGESIPTRPPRALGGGTPGATPGGAGDAIGGAALAAAERAYRILSIDDQSPTGAGGPARPLVELLEDGGEAELGFERLADREAAEDLAAVLAGLPAELRQVVTLRYGLDGEEPKSLRAAGRSLGVSPETVRRREREALTRLRRGLGGHSVFDPEAPGVDAAVPSAA